MTDWNSPATIAANALSYAKLVHALLGIFAWEWMISIDFDVAFLTGKRKFRWPMMFYLYGRYGMLAALIMFVIILDSPTEFNCMVTFRILATAGTTCIGVASVNLFIRTMAIWDRNRYIVWPLIALSTGHFGIILASIPGAELKWVDDAGCMTINAKSTVYTIMFIYTMVFDFIILILTGYKLWSLNLGTHYSAVMRLLFKDGLVYFIVTFAVNTIAMIFSMMHLNPVMALFAGLPAAVFSTIAAGQVVRRLSNHVTSGQELSIDSISGIRVNSQSVSSGACSKTPGVHIEMARFTVPDDERSTGGYEKGHVQQSDLEANQFLHGKGSEFN